MTGSRCSASFALIIAAAEARRYVWRCEGCNEAATTEDFGF